MEAKSLGDERIRKETARHESAYDPRTNIDISFQYYPSLNNWGRQRIQLDSGVKREFWKDVFFAINLFDTFDSRPPTTSADRNDVGIVLSFGWTY